jgi:hypothetical protein
VHWPEIGVCEFFIESCELQRVERHSQHLSEGLLRIVGSYKLPLIGKGIILASFLDFILHIARRIFIAQVDHFDFGMDSHNVLGECFQIDQQLVVDDFVGLEADCLLDCLDS